MLKKLLEDKRAKAPFLQAVHILLLAFSGVLGGDFIADLPANALEFSLFIFGKRVVCW